MKLLFVHDGPLYKDKEDNYYEYSYHELYERYSYIADVPAIAKSADIFCFPSHREGLGLAALEVMACGLPLVTSNVHGINDYSQNDVTGCKCSPNNLDEWVKSLNALLNNSSKRKEYGCNNMKIVNRFSDEIVVKEMEKIYSID